MEYKIPELFSPTTTHDLDDPETHARTYPLKPSSRRPLPLLTASEILDFEPQFKIPEGREVKEGGKR
jgi:hypothetical protein